MVLGLRNNFAATSRLESPCATKEAICRLLGGERHARGGIPFPGGLTGGPEFLLRPVHPGVGTEVLKGLQRGPQLLPGVDAAAGPAQELTVGKVGAGPFEGPVNRALVRTEGREKNSSATAGESSGAASNALP